MKPLKVIQVGKLPKLLNTFLRSNTTLLKQDLCRRYFSKAICHLENLEHSILEATSLVDIRTMGIQMEIHKKPTSFFNYSKREFDYISFSGSWNL